MQDSVCVSCGSHSDNKFGSQPITLTNLRMRLPLLSRALCIALLFISLHSSSQTMAIPRQIDCSLWPKLKTDPSGKAVVQGFLSGMSLMYWIEREGKVGTPRVDPLREITNMEQAYVWLDGYCASNPTEHLTVAMSAYFWELEGKQMLRRK